MSYEMNRAEHSELMNANDGSDIRYTVVVPIYNSARTIEACLRSVLSAQRADVELLLVDDGSRDASLEIIRQLLASQSWASRVVYYYGENQGVSWARNVGIDLATGRYVLFLDSDDRVSRDYFKVLDGGEDHPFLIFLMRYQLMDVLEDGLLRLQAIHGKGSIEMASVIADLLSIGLLHSANNKCFSLDRIRQWGIRFDEKLSIGEDFLFTMTYASHCSSVRLLDKAIYHVDEGNENSLSRGYRANLTEQLGYFYEQQERLIEASTFDRKVKSDLLRTMDYYRSKAVCTCIGELFKVSARPYLLRRGEIQAICRTFDRPLEGFEGYHNLIHRGLNWMLRRHIAFPLYLATYLKKEKAYRSYRQRLKEQPLYLALSFDDGRGDNYALFREILEPMGIPATFSINTAYNDGTSDPATRPTRRKPLGRGRIREMAASPLVEIACHGKEHLCDPVDALEGEQILRSWLSGVLEPSSMGYACPNSQLEESQLGGPEWRSFAYVRTGLRIRSHACLRVLARKLARLTHLPFLFAFAYGDCILAGEERGILHSVNVLRDSTVRELLALVRGALGRETAGSKGLILMFHSVDARGGRDTWCYDRERFMELCRALLAMQSRGQIRLVTTMELSRILDGDR